jgi:hypothetical protein
LIRQEVIKNEGFGHSRSHCNLYDLTLQSNAPVFNPRSMAPDIGRGPYFSSGVELHGLDLTEHARRQ